MVDQSMPGSQLCWYANTFCAQLKSLAPEGPATLRLLARQYTQQRTAAAPRAVPDPLSPSNPDGELDGVSLPDVKAQNDEPRLGGVIRREPDPEVRNVMDQELFRLILNSQYTERTRTSRNPGGPVQLDRTAKRIARRRSQIPQPLLSAALLGCLRQHDPPARDVVMDYPT